mmetsp:Transcript_12616/g.16973  ORF Transcript_12616/g.16973 Transcript_12616/m.16973 type:complete len:95 (+) Transcript_12616:96-380(+)
MQDQRRASPVADIAITTAATQIAPSCCRLSAQRPSATASVLDIGYSETDVTGDAVAGVVIGQRQSSLAATDRDDKQYCRVIPAKGAGVSRHQSS